MTSLLPTALSPSLLEKRPLSQSGVKLPLPNNDSAITKKAKEFESVFIAETLKQAKMNLAPKELEGSNSLVTDTFDSFMYRAMADGIVKQGGFGLAKHIAASLQSPSHP